MQSESVRKLIGAPRQKQGVGKYIVPIAFWAEQGRGADSFQRPLVPRSRFQPQLPPGIRRSQ